MDIHGINVNAKKATKKQEESDDSTLSPETKRRKFVSMESVTVLEIKSEYSALKFYIDIIMNLYLLF